MSGTFGYELDVTAITEDEQRQIPEQIARFKALQPLIQSGNYYRISSVACNGGWDAQMVVSKDRREAAVFVIRVLDAPNQAQKCLRLQGLDPAGMYEDQEIGQRWPGDVLHRIGLPVSFPAGDFQGKILFLCQV